MRKWVMLFVRHHKVWCGVAAKFLIIPKNPCIANFKQLFGLTPLYCHYT